MSICHEDERRYEQFVRQQAQKQAAAAAADGDDEQSSTRQLYEWCRKDAACCAAYYMKDCSGQGGGGGGGDGKGEYSDFETFRYLTSHWHTPNEPLTSLLDAGGYCGHQRTLGLRHADNAREDTQNQTEEEGEHDSLQRVLKYAWLVEMRLQTYEHSLVHCSENEHFVYSPNDAEGRCICNAHASEECHTVRRHRQRDPWNNSMTAIIVAAVAATILFILYIINTIKQLSVYDKLSKEIDAARAATDANTTATATTSAPRDRFLSMLHQRQSAAVTSIR